MIGSIMIDKIKQKMILFPLVLSCTTAIIYVNLEKIKKTIPLGHRIKWALISVVLSQVIFYSIYFTFNDTIINYSNSYITILFFPVLPILITIISIKVFLYRNPR